MKNTGLTKKKTLAKKKQTVKKAKNKPVIHPAILNTRKKSNSDATMYEQSFQGINQGNSQKNQDRTMYDDIFTDVDMEDMGGMNESLGGLGRQSRMLSSDDMGGMNNSLGGLGTKGKNKMLSSDDMGGMNNSLSGLTSGIGDKGKMLSSGEMGGMNNSLGGLTKKSPFKPKTFYENIPLPKPIIKDRSMSPPNQSKNTTRNANQTPNKNTTNSNRNTNQNTNQTTTQGRPNATIMLNGNKYMKLTTLGEGSFGKVDKVKRVSDDKLFVLKILFDKQNAERDYDIEQSILSILKERLHCNAGSHFLCIEDHGPVTINGRRYFAILTKYIDAIDLFDFVPDNGIRSLKQLKQICIDLMEGYLLIQQAGVIHRDIKPENILIRKEGNKYHTTYIDFGLSCLANSSTKGNHLGCDNRAGAGTPMYKAPEGMNKPHMDIMEGDIYSLGVVFYFLASKRDDIFNAIGKNGKTNNQLFYDNVTNNTGRLPIQIDNDYFRNLVDDMISYNWDSRPKPEEVLRRLNSWTL